MFYKSSEAWNVEYACNVIKMCNALLRMAELEKIKDLPSFRQQIDEAVEYWNKQINDNINLLLAKKNPG